jgi:hypothetical protein
MSLPREQNRDEDERPIPPVPNRKSVASEKAGLRNSGTAEVTRFSRLSAQMVELSLQQAQREPTLREAISAKANAPADLNPVSPPLHDTLPVQPKAVSPPLPWPSAVAEPPDPPQSQGTPRESRLRNYWHNFRPNFRKDVRGNLDPWFARARVRGSDAVQHLFEHAKSARKKFALLSLKSWNTTASRLWTSAGVAALSAVLLVGVVFGVRHYAYTPDTPQHRGQGASPATPVMQDISQPRRSSIVGTNGVAAMQHPSGSSAAAKHAAASHAPREHAPREHGIRKIRRRNKDDDYVAKDTFVSYDNKGKPVR